MRVKTLEMMRLLNEDNRRCATTEFKYNGKIVYYNCFIESDILKFTDELGKYLFYQIDFNCEWDIIEPDLSTKEAFDEMFLNNKGVESNLTGKVYCKGIVSLKFCRKCSYGEIGRCCCIDQITKEEYQSTWKSVPVL